MYLNAETLGGLLSKYGDPITQHIYLGQWTNLGKYFHTSRISDGKVSDSITTKLTLLSPFGDIHTSVTINL